jgi:hypothetical protein
MRGFRSLIVKQVLVCLAAFAFARGLRAQDYFVAPRGHDSNPGTLALPFGSFARAVRSLKAGDTLYLRQGVYRETIYVPRGGTAGAPIVFKAFGSETAVLAGSVPVKGVWKHYQGAIWTMDGLTTTSELIMDGQELPLARWPAAPPGAAMTQGWAIACSGTTPTALCDPAMPDLPLAGAQVHVIPGLAWVSYTRAIRNYGKGSLTFGSPVAVKAAYLPRPGNLYYLYNSLALLRSPGAWYQDPATGRLYVWAPDSLSPAKHAVERAQRKLVAYDNGFSYVEFRGLYTFCGGIKISRCTGCRVDGVKQRLVQHYTDVQGYYSESPTNGFSGGSGCEWSNGTIEGSSGDGLGVSGKGQKVDHMLIHDVCRAGDASAAIALLGTDPDVEYNTCYDSGRYLINLGNAKGGTVSHNDLYRAGLLTKDVGAIYSFQTDGGGMVIAYNHVHDIASTRGIGIYLDNGDENYIVHHNLVHDCAWSALELNLPSNDNYIYNNTLWNCKHWVWADGAPHSMTGTVLANNLYTGTCLLVTRKMKPTELHNATYAGPMALFKPGDWTLARGSWAIGKGMVLRPYTDGWCGSAPDLGAFPYRCASPWVAGCAVDEGAFPYPPAVSKAKLDSKGKARRFWSWL